MKKTKYNPYETDPNLKKFVESITEYLGYTFDEEKIESITKMLQENMDNEIDRIIQGIWRTRRESFVRRKIKTI